MEGQKVDAIYMMSTDEAYVYQTKKNEIGTCGMHGQKCQLSQVESNDEQVHAKWPLSAEYSQWYSLFYLPIW